MPQKYFIHLQPKLSELQQKQVEELLQTKELIRFKDGFLYSLPKSSKIKNLITTALKLDAEDIEKYCKNV